MTPLAASLCTSTPNDPILILIQHVAGPDGAGVHLNYCHPSSICTSSNQTTMSTTPAHQMEYVRLGKSGLKVRSLRLAPSESADSQVSRLIMGCMQYGSQQSWMISDHAEGIKQLKYAYDQGINVDPARLQRRFTESADVRHCKHLLCGRIGDHPRRIPPTGEDPSGERGDPDENVQYGRETRGQGPSWMDEPSRVEPQGESRLPLRTSI